MAGNRTWYAFARWFTRNTFFRYTGELRSVDEHRVPQEGPLIVAPIHLSLLDPPAVACATRRQINFLAKEELFRGFFGWLIRSLGAFPIKRGEGDSESIRTSIAVLERGEALLVFPEGTRGDGQTMLPINRGVAMFAKRTKAQVVPVGIVGSERILGRDKGKKKRQKITVAFGEPFRYADVAIHDSERTNREAFAAELQRRILELCRANGMDLKAAPDPTGSKESPAPARTLED
jgi:1-acyl-sn-glycerol-3-phosphate acyltransferase